MSWARRSLPAALLGCTLSAMGFGMAVAAPAAPTRAGAGDEATLAARRSDLVRRLAEAEHTGTLSPAEAARHRHALDVMIASARRDLRRTPHFISAAENATYRRTIADVEAALERRGAAHAVRPD